MKTRYDSYKSSGIDWIGEIPSHWRIVRMRYLCDIITGDKDTVNKVDNGQYPFYVRSPQIERINSYTFDGEAVLMAGDGVGAGKVVHYANGKFDFHQRVYNFHNFREIKGILLYQYLKTLFKYKIEEGGAKNTVDSVRQPWLKDFPICIPPLSEQEAIAGWLDEKCGEIDGAIAKVDREIELIDELKQSEISRVVSRGLNPDASLRPSGIDWIGDVPEHWKVKRLRFVCEFRNGYTPSKDNKEFWTNGTIPWYRMEDIRDSGRFLNEAKQYISEEAIKGGGLFEAGSFILATTATIGEHAILIVDSLANQRFTNLKIRKSLIEPVSKEFFFYYLFVIDEFCKSTTKTTTFPAMDMTDLRNFGVCIPPLSEQKAIADYLDKKCAEIDSLKEKLVKKRDTLKELRQAIISEVVTGKRKVV